MLKVAKESLSNSFRHGKATIVSVVLKRVKQTIRLIVEDRGQDSTRKFRETRDEA